MRAVAFSAASSRYAVVDVQHDGEFRFTDRDAVQKLGPLVADAVFIGDALLVRYESGIVEVHREDRSVLRIEGVTSAAPIPGTHLVLLRCRETGSELLDVSTGRRVPIATSASPSRTVRPEGASLAYFVLDGNPHEIRAAADGSRVLTAGAIGSSPASPWVCAVTADGVELFDLRNGRRIPLDGEVEKTPRHWAAISLPAGAIGSSNRLLYAWPDVPVMVIATVPAQIRRISDGRLLTTLPGGLKGLLQLTPDRRLVYLPAETASSPSRSEAAFYDTSRGTRSWMFSGDS